MVIIAILLDTYNTKFVYKLSKLTIIVDNIYLENIRNFFTLS